MDIAVKFENNFWKHANNIWKQNWTYFFFFGTRSKIYKFNEICHIEFEYVSNLFPPPLEFILSPRLIAKEISIFTQAHDINQLISTYLTNLSQKRK